ncbi:hypothetical protein [Rheinheimera sp. MMS21-TC3]|uniref:hypothetical protein n=1 Tax=Rheinheimera sp. MMS21-TC3 TaxID=3072790 RepID=UPI0028C4E5A4|nr:hypothetical protein [Rheinheimera sp. MMS21-TC3]WNO59784.1 hypothetical protein RDV63_02140 [Rheinheimera sp. MMS21-TC3]
MKYILISLSLLAYGANAAVPTEQAIELCRAEQNALKRLVCYDAINVGSAITTAKSATTTATPAAEADTNTEGYFGLEHKRNVQDPDVINVTVKSFEYSLRKELIIEFDNGQIWRQKGTQYYPIAVGEEHRITRGVLNSFRLGNDRNNRTISIGRQQ